MDDERTIRLGAMAAKRIHEERVKASTVSAARDAVIEAARKYEAAQTTSSMRHWLDRIVERTQALNELEREK